MAEPRERIARHDKSLSHRGDGNVAQTATDNANLLAQHFSNKMCITEPHRPPPPLAVVAEDKTVRVTTSTAEAKHLSMSQDKNKNLIRAPVCSTSAPRNWLVHLPHSSTTALETSRWPIAWKVSRAVCQAPARLLKPRSRKWPHQRQSTNKYVTLWNALLTPLAGYDSASVQQFKERLNTWLMT